MYYIQSTIYYLLHSCPYFLYIYIYIYIFICYSNAYTLHCSLMYNSSYVVHRTTLYIVNGVHQLVCSVQYRVHSAQHTIHDILYMKYRIQYKIKIYKYIFFRFSSCLFLYLYRLYSIAGVREKAYSKFEQVEPYKFEKPPIAQCSPILFTTRALTELLLE